MADLGIASNFNVGSARHVENGVAPILSQLAQAPALLSVVSAGSELRRTLEKYQTVTTALNKAPAPAASSKNTELPELRLSDQMFVQAKACVAIKAALDDGKDPAPLLPNAPMTLLDRSAHRLAYLLSRKYREYNQTRANEFITEKVHVFLTEIDDNYVSPSIVALRSRLDELDGAAASANRESLTLNEQFDRLLDSAARIDKAAESLARIRSTLDCIRAYRDPLPQVADYLTKTTQVLDEHAINSKIQAHERALATESERANLDLISACQKWIATGLELTKASQYSRQHCFENVPNQRSRLEFLLTLSQIDQHFRSDKLLSTSQQKTAAQPSSTQGNPDSNSQTLREMVGRFLNWLKSSEQDYLDANQKLLGDFACHATNRLLAKEILRSGVIKSTARQLRDAKRGSGTVSINSTIGTRAASPSVSLSLNEISLSYTATFSPGASLQRNVPAWAATCERVNTFVPGDTPTGVGFVFPCSKLLENRFFQLLAPAPQDRAKHDSSVRLEVFDLDYSQSGSGTEVDIDLGYFIAPARDEDFWRGFLLKPLGSGGAGKSAQWISERVVFYDTDEPHIALFDLILEAQGKPVPVPTSAFVQVTNRSEPVLSSILPDRVSLLELQEVKIP